ncbi:MAG: diguanylate cyclase [Gammaproteobacteria bacterium]|nr:MAG: diguanylate cyclase [Gammaproteobacteria bacterium]
MNTKTIADLEEEIKQLKKLLRDRDNVFLNIIGKNRDGILIFDLKGRIVYANPAALELFDKDLGALLGESIGIFIDGDKKTAITIAHKIKGLIHVELNIADITWNDQPARLASLRDITHYTKMQSVLEHLSHFDYLTNLPNRISFEETLKKAMHRADRIHKKVALLFLDMDGFKKVNDTYGHHMGDQLLVQVAKLLTETVRAEDLVSRLGGDEFAIILERIGRDNYCEQIARNIIRKISQPIYLSDKEIRINFSIGIALYPTHAVTAYELIKNADAAMYQAKISGSGRYHVCSE